MTGINVCGVGFCLLDGIKMIHGNRKTCTRIIGDESEWFNIRMVHRFGMSSRIFNLFVEGGLNFPSNIL